MDPVTTGLAIAGGLAKLIGGAVASGMSAAEARALVLAHLNPSPVELRAYHQTRKRLDELKAEADELFAGLAARESQREHSPVAPEPDTLPGGESPLAYDLEDEGGG